MRVEFIQTDDWVELVLDGERVYGNHSIANNTLLEFLGFEFSSRWIDNESEYEAVIGAIPVRGSANKNEVEL